MKPVVLDTNILLDIFVFNDERASPLKQAMMDGDISVIASQKTLLELADVISRPLFKLDEAAQASILAQWQAIVGLHDDSNLATAPWKCQDPDDQIFLDLAYQLKPAILISKDNALLEIASRAAQENILITSDYNAFKL
ncbi:MULTISPECIES: putative toxin-antitoxin system toxin component, PIN family [unclassified Polynucleobacter]|jgi:putative PIN family toxin of toxin-antitoxin system|uniref:putative toxin-antitoxin system toxin component, PIN family n=1 Tax=unclassified Polynucleobacter TaxID=2640945 RepID=UPI000BDABA11|nr:MULTISPECIES: putative toxin-antitoxin system toxin component, PIN family [unclassified Polynucleobacter]OYY21755.1 MAG: putative toxin-antitoxin system toxin component, PIN family [Polynucleobacter sp. 35-46-11]OZA78425.1 MAG: putative toxin-antitoxin system toxin component, PIN family [Polynucleobacter sp. 39-46-10]